MGSEQHNETCAIRLCHKIFLALDFHTSRSDWFYRFIFKILFLIIIATYANTNQNDWCIFLCLDNRRSEWLIYQHCCINQKDAHLQFIKLNRTKKCFLLNPKHKHVKINKSNKKLLLEIVSFYNNTKFVILVADQMAREYHVKSGSRRWRLQVFLNILRLAGINAWILNKNAIGENVSRKDFLFRLSEERTSKYQVLK